MKHIDNSKKGSAEQAQEDQHMEQEERDEEEDNTEEEDKQEEEENEVQTWEQQPENKIQCRLPGTNIKACQLNVRGRNDKVKRDATDKRGTKYEIYIFTTQEQKQIRTA